MKRRFLIVLAMLGVVLGGTLPVTAQAESRSYEVPVGLGAIARAEIAAGEAVYIDEATLAASGCGRACDDKSPTSYKIYHSGCSTCYHYCADDAVTKRWGVSSSPGLELRYSARCRTAWTKVSYADSYAWIESYYTDGRFRKSTGGFAGQYYTNMLDDAGLLAYSFARVGPTTYYTSPGY
jgi:hypothetical protein